MEYAVVRDGLEVIILCPAGSPRPLKIGLSHRVTRARDLKSCHVTILNNYMHMYRTTAETEGEVGTP